MSPGSDIRMKGFARRAAVADVLDDLRARTGATLPAEPVPLAAAAGRVLADPVTSAVDVPAFPKSAMDGFAARSADLTAAVVLRLVGESLPGRPFVGEVGPGQTARIMTGAPLPAGADCVAQAELADEQPDGLVRVREAVAAGRHVIRVGEDVAASRVVLPAGRMLRPQDVGLLAAIGAGEVRVVRRPRVAALVTGDELLPPGAVPSGYRIVDSNTPMLAALVARDGGEWLGTTYLPDDFDAIRAAVKSADADVLLLSGGTSVGTEDHAADALRLECERLIHGVSLRPAGPTGVGFLRRGGVAFLLPGNPVSCLCAYDLFAGRAVRRLGGRGWELPYRVEKVTAGERIASEVGRVDYVRVRVRDGAAVPLPGGASRLSTAVEADGFVLVGHDRDAIAPGEPIDVYRYD